MIGNVQDPLVYVVILNWNTKDDAVECIDSVKKSTYGNYKIIMIDNGSNDGSVEIFEKEYPEVTLVANATNLGYCAGNNIGIKAALANKADYLFLLNSDIVIDEYCIERLVDVLKKNNTLGIVGPINYYYDEKDRPCFIKGRVNLYTGQAYHVDIDKNSLDNLPDIISTDYITGAATMIKSDVFTKIGVLDERYFYLHDDSDFSLRAREAGFDLSVVHNAKVWHKASVSVGGTGSLLQTYYGTRNMWLLMRKHGKVHHWLIFMFYYVYKIIIKRSLHVFRQSRYPKMKMLKVVWGGILDSCIGHYGPAPLWVNK